MDNTFSKKDDSQDEDAYINEPRPDYVGEIIDEPVVRKGLFVKGEEHTLFTTRAPYSMIREGKAQLITETGESYEVTIIGTGRIQPTMEAVKSGQWRPGDVIAIIRSSELPIEIVKKARKVVQKR